MSDGKSTSPDNYESMPLSDAVSTIFTKLDEMRASGEEESLDCYSLKKRLYKNLAWESLRNINSTRFDGSQLCKMWEENIDHAWDNNIGMIQSLLHVTSLSPKIYRYINNQYGGIHFATDRLFIETHRPPAIDGKESMSSFFACDDKLPHVINFQGNPFHAVSSNEFQLRLDKFMPLEVDEFYPRGRMGMVSLTDTTHILFSRVPLAGSSSDSRGIVMPDQLYTAGKNNPLHMAWVPGLDTNMDRVISMFRHYHETGNDPTSNNLSA